MSRSDDRFHAYYRVAGGLHEAYARAKDICVEQTVEFPIELVPERIRRDVMGRVEGFRKAGKRSFEARISFPCGAAGGELTQLLNVLFGNISIKPGILLTRFELPASLLKRFDGPRYGIPGLRRLFRAPRRPFLCTAVKPMGLPALKLSELTYRFGLGGIDLIKDDHGLADQPWARFAKRVRLCARAARAASRETGRPCAYAPNVTAPYPSIVERALIAHREGAGALLVSPGLAGFGVLQHLSRLTKLPLLSHPALLGTYVMDPGEGISHRVLFGQLTRLAGADATIFPNFGGRFSFTREECRAVARGAKEGMGPVKPIFPVPGGGMGLSRIPEMLRFYGKDVMLLVGGGLLQDGPDITGNAERFRRLVEGRP